MSTKFVPTAASTRTGSLTVVTDASGNPPIITLTGTGLASGGYIYSQSAYAGYAYSQSAYSSGNANNYYISPSGSDSNPGSQASPWKTLSHADAALSLGSGGNCVSSWITLPNAGACVHVLPGTYSPGSSNLQTRKNGGPTTQIYYISETRWGAKITNSTWTMWGNWSNVEGFEFTAPTGIANAITIQTGNNKGVDYNYIHDINTGDCTYAGIINQTNLPSQNDRINGNIIRHFGTTTSSNPACAQNYHGIYTDGGGVTITNNIISAGAGGWGIQRQYQSGHNSAADCAPGIISNNTIFNNQGGFALNENGTCAFDYWTLSNNIIVNNGVNGTCHSWNGSTCGGSSFGIDYWQISAGSTHNVVNNNMVYGNLPGNYAHTGNTCTPGTAQCPGLNTKSDPNTGITFINFQNDTNTAPASNYNADNYQLKLGSNAINQGTTSCAGSPGLSPCTPSTDFAGKTRPQGSAIDIGAYEQ